MWDFFHSNELDLNLDARKLPKNTICYRVDKHHLNEVRIRLTLNKVGYIWENKDEYPNYDL